MSDLERALALVLGIEGGLSDRDPHADPGGKTVWGISERSHPAAWRNGPPTKAEAIEIYRRDYWAAAGCDRLPWPINLLVFDFAVNSGVSRAVRALQTALKVIPDGIVGPVTTAIAAKKARDREWIGLFLADRAIFMSALSNWEANKRGWLKRLNWLAFEAGKVL